MVGFIKDAFLPLSAIFAPSWPDFGEVHAFIKVKKLQNAAEGVGGWMTSVAADKRGVWHRSILGAALKQKGAPAQVPFTALHRKWLDRRKSGSLQDSSCPAHYRLIQFLLWLQSWLTADLIGQSLRNEVNFTIPKTTCNDKCLLSMLHTAETWFCSIQEGMSMDENCKMLEDHAGENLTLIFIFLFFFNLKKKCYLSIFLQYSIT